jgi:hypothetical protein
MPTVKRTAHGIDEVGDRGLNMQWPRLHPWWTQAVLQGRRSFDFTFKAACTALLVLTLGASALLAGDATAARWLLGGRVPAALLVATALVLVLRQPIAGLARSLRYGWMAALPLPPQAGRRTLLSAAAALSMLALAWLAAGLAGLGVALGMPAYLRMLGTLAIGVAAAWLVLAWFAFHVWRQPRALPARAGVRVPVLPVSWLEDPRLPGLVAWQHRECTLRWRTAGGAKPVCLVLLLFPGSPSPWSLLLLLIIVLLAAWYRCVLQSALQVAVRAGALIAAWPLRRRLAAHALLRFPLAAGAVTSAVLFAMLLTRLSLLPSIACSVAILLASAPITLARLAAWSWNSFH